MIDRRLFDQSSGVAVKVAAITANNLRRLVRQPVMLFTTLALPFMVILVVGSALGGSRSQLHVGIVSHTHDDLSTSLVAAIRRSSALDATTYQSDGDLERAVRRGQVNAGIIVPDGYAAALRRGDRTTIRFVTTPDQRRSATIRTVVSGVVDEQTAALQAATFSHRHTGRDVAAETARATVLLDQVAVPVIETQSVTKGNNERLGFEYTAPSNLVLFIVITSLTSSAALIETRTRGITARMFTMPVGRTTVVLGELLGRFVVALAQAAVILFLSAIAFGVSWGDPAAVAVVTLVLCAFGAALGMLVGFGARTMSQAVAFGPPLGVALGMLGGCMWPLSIVGHVVRAVGHITPHAWAMDAYLKLINDQAGVAAVISQIGVVAAFAAGTLVLAGLVARWRIVR